MVKVKGLAIRATRKEIYFCLILLRTELLFGASLRLDRKERSAEDEIPPILGIVELEDASGEC